MNLMIGWLFLPQAPSEAAPPSIPIQIVGVTSAVTITLGANSGSSAERTTNSTACYPLQGPTGDGTTPDGDIVHNAPNAIAKRLIAGKTGSGGRRQAQETAGRFAKRLF